MSTPWHQDDKLTQDEGTKIAVRVLSNLIASKDELGKLLDSADSEGHATDAALMKVDRFLYVFADFFDLSREIITPGEDYKHRLELGYGAPLRKYLKSTDVAKMCTVKSEVHSKTLESEPATPGAAKSNIAESNTVDVGRSRTPSVVPVKRKYLYSMPSELSMGHANIKASYASDSDLSLEFDSD